MWHQNLDGQGTFGALQPIVQTFAAFVGFEVADMDGDGDVDVLSGSNAYQDFGTDGTVHISWYENGDGQGQFGAEHFIERITTARRMKLAVSDVDGDGDLDALASYQDFSGNGGVRWYENRVMGDSNDDGVFDSGDLVTVFQSGKYEDDMSDNTNFDEGDWNGDGDFDSGDLVFAFQAGTFVAASRPASIASAVEFLFAEGDETEYFQRKSST